METVMSWTVGEKWLALSVRMVYVRVMGSSGRMWERVSSGICGK